MTRTSKQIASVVALGLLVSCAAFAVEIVADGTSQADVQAAVDAAETGDVVIIPAGESTWTEAIWVSPEKRITIQGSGVDRTVIASNKGGTLINISTSGSRVTGFQIRFLIDDNSTGVRVSGVGWRVDNMRFVNESGSTIEGVIAAAQSIDGHPVGVVDHNVFIDSRVIVLGSLDLYGNHIWAEPLGLGTNNAVFVENNSFTRLNFGNAVDSHYAGRYVFRYNEVHDAYVEVHSSYGADRAGRSWEIYENTFTQSDQSVYMPFRLRGGTGVVFNNTLAEGSWTDPNIGLDNVRSCNGECDGTSAWDGNESGEQGYPCRDQIGRSTDEWLWTDANPYPPQELDPAYAWNNVHGSEPVEFKTDQCTTSQFHIQEGRDYINGTPRPGYVPYTYPHPLVEEWGGNPATDGGWLQEPSRLRIEGTL